MRPEELFAVRVLAELHAMIEDWTLLKAEELMGLHKDRAEIVAAALAAGDVVIDEYQAVEQTDERIEDGAGFLMRIAEARHRLQSVPLIRQVRHGGDVATA